MNELKKKVNGITLIALVVTIIVLLILAGVAINLTIGNNGLFTRANNSRMISEQANILEQLRMITYEKSSEIDKSKMSYIDYFKERGIIVEEIGKVKKLETYASAKSEIELNNEELDDGTKYIINVENVISNPSTGKGKLADGDVYYILNGELHYLNKEKAEKLIGKVFEKEETDSSYFNYIVNDDYIEIIGFNFNNIPNKNLVSANYRKNNGISIGIEHLVIPAKIKGKPVTEVSFGNHIGNSDDLLVLKEIKEITYPKTTKKIKEGNIVWEDLETINLQEGLTELYGQCFMYSEKVNSIIIPSTLKKVSGSPFMGCFNAVVYFLGKDSIEEIEYVGIGDYHSLNQINHTGGKLKLEFMGK